MIDVQNYFASLCEPFLPVLRRAVADCRGRGVAVVFTQHGHAPDDEGMLHEWWGEVIEEGSNGHGLILDPADDPVVAKNRYDAFFGTELEPLLRGRGVADLAFAGVMTNLCVETTARSAFVRDFRVRVLSDATATNTDAMLRASLRNLEYGFAHIQTTKEWLDGMARTACADP